MVDAIPDGTTWAGFGINPVGATYSSTDDQVKWSGPISASSPPLTFTFGVDVDLTNWAFGNVITNAALFNSGAGLVFTHTTTNMVDIPDPSASTKGVNQSKALAGEVLTYTMHVENLSAISDTFVLVDPLPPNTTYIPGSLTYTLGTGGYDAGTNVITWSETLPSTGTYINTSGDYEWGDSDGKGTVPGVTFDWIDISRTGTSLNFNDDEGDTIPIGFNPLLIRDR